MYYYYNLQISNFLIIVCFLCVILWGLLKLNHFLTVRVTKKITESYECGFLPFDDARMKITLQFYLIALLFISSDIEILLLLPWCLYFISLGFISFFFVGWFILILILGFGGEWFRGGLELLEIKK